MTNMETKLTLKACRSFEEFDNIMDQTWCKTDSDKIEYLMQLFNVEVVHATNDNKRDDYIALAHTIMNYA